ncbi:MAG TPA: hypothetical protein VGK30_03820 [Candidatus Binatia bacterium]
MRMLTAVMVGVVVLGMASAARTDDRNVQMDYAVCSQKCDNDYQSCMRWRKGKANENCEASVLKCRNTCSPQWREITKKEAAPVTCRDKCQAGFDSCTHADDGKHGGNCQRDFMVCRNGCPPEQPPVAAVESAPPAAAVAAPAGEPAPAAAPAAEPPPAVAVPAAAPPPAPEKASAPAPAIDKREAAPNPVPPARAGAALPEKPQGPTSGQPAVAQSTTRASEPKRSVWAKVYCTMFYCGSGATAQKPLSCEDKCVADYDDCLAHADPKRGTDQCSSGSLRCRQGCERKGS